MRDLGRRAVLWLVPLDPQIRETVPGAYTVTSKRTSSLHPSCWWFPPAARYRVSQRGPLLPQRLLALQRQSASTSASIKPAPDAHGRLSTARASPTSSAISIRRWERGHHQPQDPLLCLSGTGGRCDSARGPGGHLSPGSVVGTGLPGVARIALADRQDRSRRHRVGDDPDPGVVERAERAPEQIRADIRHPFRRAAVLSEAADVREESARHGLCLPQPRTAKFVFSG
jgi:hypothetical protein